MGLRGFFEEEYSGDSLPGIYVAGVYYPDKTRVGWWKNGYPEFFAKVVNSPNWAGINIEVEGSRVDLAHGMVRDFRRELDMQHGVLTRSFVYQGVDGKETAFRFTRFLSMDEETVACLNVWVKPLNYDGTLTLVPYLDGDVVNEDANYGEKFWVEEDRMIRDDAAVLVMRTEKTGFLLAASMTIRATIDGEAIGLPKTGESREKYLAYTLTAQVKTGQELELEKYVAVCSSRDHSEEEVAGESERRLQRAVDAGYGTLRAAQAEAWRAIWEHSDVTIDGDVWAQQGIRFNIFQLHQTYTGKDPRLNIGPKGFTGEKYGGCTYWDTEAFCFPFYLYTDAKVARNLLYYRYLQLEQARENAAKLGLKGALYPMVTIDGRECHNEWEITFEEIHRNAAMAYAIYNYTRYTEDREYLYCYGLEVLIETSRFWADRVTYQPRKDRYMILGVTGPNEYENNINNNWYTNTMAAWHIGYTLESLEAMQREDEQGYVRLVQRLSLAQEETLKWGEIVDKMYFPYWEDMGVVEQHDGYRDKEILTVNDLSKDELPLNKHWSWDRILRSCFIKQADVVQGLYFFPDRFDEEMVGRNFDFYEPRTVHESSLSASVHSIVASRLGYREKAYDLYLRTARLDLDNYNKDTDDGLHLTSMAGSWLAIVEGFAGMRVTERGLEFKPYLPEAWKGYEFKLNFRGRRLAMKVGDQRVEITLLAGEDLKIFVNGEAQMLTPEKCLELF